VNRPSFAEAPGPAPQQQLTGEHPAGQPLARPAPGPDGAPTGPTRRSVALPTNLTRERLVSEAKTRFRMPGTADPKVRLRRLAGVAGWATVLGLAGLVVGFRVVIALFTNGPTWYPLTICALGLLGIAGTVAGFASVHRRRLPWLSLGAATVILIIAWKVNY